MQNWFQSMFCVVVTFSYNLFQCLTAVSAVKLFTLENVPSVSILKIQGPVRHLLSLSFRSTARQIAGNSRTIIHQAI